MNPTSQEGATELSNTMKSLPDDVLLRAVIGVIGALLFVLLLPFLLVALVCLGKKYKGRDKKELESCPYLDHTVGEGGSVAVAVAETNQRLTEEVNTQTILKTSGNDAYGFTALHIPTESNVAYLQIGNDYINEHTASDYDYVVSTS